jgi:hypothetical protein
MGKLIRASVLTLLLVCSASAGIITHGVAEPAPSPTPQPSQEVREQSAEPEPAAASEASDETAIQLVVEVALDFLALF